MKEDYIIFRVSKKSKIAVEKIALKNDKSVSEYMRQVVDFIIEYKPEFTIKKK